MVKRIRCRVVRSVPLRLKHRWSCAEPSGSANIGIVKAIPPITTLGEYRHTAFADIAADRDGSPDNCPAGPYEKLYEIPHGLFLDVLA